MKKLLSIIYLLLGITLFVSCTNGGSSINNNRNEEGKNENGILDPRCVNHVFSDQYNLSKIDLDKVDPTDENVLEKCGYEKIDATCLCPETYDVRCDYCGQEFTHIIDGYSSDYEFEYTNMTHNFVDGKCSICNNKEEEIPFNYKIVSAKDKTIALNLANIYTDDLELEELHIPSNYYGYTVVGVYAVNNDYKKNNLNMFTKLKKIYLPKSIKKYSGSIFPYGDYYYGYNEETGSNQMLDEKISYDLYYEGTLEDWLNIDFGVGELDSRIEYKSNPLYYANNFYVNNELIKDVVIPDDVKKLNSFSFVGTCINSLLLHDKLEEIGSSIISKNTNIKLNEFENGYYLPTKNNPYYMLVGNNGSDTLKMSDKCELVGCEAFYEIDSIINEYGYSRDCYNIVDNIYISKNVKKFNKDAVVLIERYEIFLDLLYDYGDVDEGFGTNLYYDGTLTDWMNIEFEINAPYEYELYARPEFLGTRKITSNPMMVYNNIFIDDNPIVENQLSYYQYNIYPTLYDLEIPKGTKEIKAGVFYGLHINEVILPKSVKKINAYAFDRFHILSYEGKLEDWMKIEFTSVAANPFYDGLYYNYSIESNFANDSNIRAGAKCLEMDGIIYGYYYDITSEEYINSHSSITSVLNLTIPEFIKKIGYAQFAGMYFIRRLEFHDDVTEIGDYAFAGAYLAYFGLGREFGPIVLPKKLKRLGTGAFMDVCYLYVWIPKTIEYLGYCSFYHGRFINQGGVYYPIVCGKIFFEGNAKKLIPLRFSYIEIYGVTNYEDCYFYNIDKDNIVFVTRECGENKYLDYYYLEGNEATLIDFDETSVKDIELEGGVLIIPDNIVIDGKRYDVTKIQAYSINNELYQYTGYFDDKVTGYCLQFGDNIKEIGFLYNVFNEIYLNEITIQTSNKSFKLTKAFENIINNRMFKFNIQYIE